jgi:predicted acetyltransferase
MPLELVTPSLGRLPAFVDALARGWSPDNLSRDAVIRALRARIDHDPAGFIAQQDDPDGSGPPVVLPDGTAVPRLPGFHLWLWDGEFCGSLNARWSPGTTELPPHCLGHIGYAVVPWKRRRGYATQALRRVLPRLRGLGLPFVELTTDAANVPSQRVILAAGGYLVEAFAKPTALGGGDGLRFRLDLEDCTGRPSLVGAPGED